MREAMTAFCCIYRIREMSVGDYENNQSDAGNQDPQAWFKGYTSAYMASLGLVPKDILFARAQTTTPEQAAADDIRTLTGFVLTAAEVERQAGATKPPLETVLRRAITGEQDKKAAYEQLADEMRVEAASFAETMKSNGIPAERLTFQMTVPTTNRLFSGDTKIVSRTYAFWKLGRDTRYGGGTLLDNVRSSPSPAGIVPALKAPINPELVVTTNGTIGVWYIRNGRTTVIKHPDGAPSEVFLDRSVAAHPHLSESIRKQWQSDLAATARRYTARK
jgi:hypothetical protein